MTGRPYLRTGTSFTPFTEKKSLSAAKNILEVLINEFFFSDIFKRVYAKSFQFDNVVRLWAGPRLMVFLFHPDDVEVILSSQVYIDKSSEYKFFEPWLGNGLLISTGKKQNFHQLISLILYLIIRILFGKD